MLTEEEKKIYIKTLQAALNCIEKDIGFALSLNSGDIRFHRKEVSRMEVCGHDDYVTYMNWECADKCINEIINMEM